MPAKPEQNPHPASAAATRRILTVDDHPLVRRGLAALVHDEPDLEICGEAAEPAGALAALEATAVDLAIVDISLEEGDGIELISQIRRKHPEVKLLVVSMHDESLYAERALRAGAQGYVHKEAAPDSILEAIRQVLAGHMYLSAELNDQLLRQAINGSQSAEQPAVAALTDREREVFGFIGDGLTTREIAARLHLSVKTIETHRDHIKHKLDCRNAAALSRCAVQWRLENG